MFSAAPGRPMCAIAASSLPRRRHQSAACGFRSNRSRHSPRCSTRPSRRDSSSASAKPGSPSPGQLPAPPISGTASDRWVACISSITTSVSRVRRWARITAAIDAFQASTSIAGASHSSRGSASGSTSGGAFSSRNSGNAPSAAASATAPPTQVLAPSAARATASAASRRPAPRPCVTTTPTPAPTTRNRMNSIATTWLASAKAAPALSDSRAASTVPMTPTAMPSSSSRNSGQARVKRRGGGFISSGSTRQGQQTTEQRPRR